MVFKEAQKYLEKRQRGDFFPKNDIQAFRATYSQEHDTDAIREWEPLLPFYLAARQIAKYLFQLDSKMRERLYPLLASAITLFDMIVLHEKILIDGDTEFQNYVESIAMFSEYGQALIAELEGGPLISEEAFFD